MTISRRQFLKYCTVAAGALGLTATDLIKLEQALAKSPGAGLPVVWIAGQACTGCTTSLANSVSIETVTDLLLLNQANLTLDLRVIETLMASMSTQATQTAVGSITSSAFALVVEGSIPAIAALVPKDGYCTIGSYTGAASENVGDVVRYFANSTNCAAILTVGTCSSYGGVPASKPKPTGAMGVLEYMNNSSTIKEKMISIPGCPPNPNWIVGTLAEILINLANGNGVVLPNVDNIRRPKTYYGSRVCNSCYRYPQAAKKATQINPRLGDQMGHQIMNGPDDGTTPSTAYCLRSAGCKGMKTSADCAFRKWNAPGFNQGGVNWCVGAGAPCQGCVQKGFPDMFSPILNLS